MVLLKIVGIIFMILGFLILRFFPDIVRYQRSEMTMAGILIGIVFFGLGLTLLIFG